LSVRLKRTGLKNEFNAEIVGKLKSYVYRVIAPRNGETFYVGKGVGNRVFQHVAGISNEDASSEKIERIRIIQLSGLSVIHIIHRHGMDDDTASQVEGALIDTYPGISNVMGGIGNSDYGAMHSSEIINKYSAPEVVFQHKAVIINISRTAAADTLYESTRYAWRLNLGKAREAEVVLAVRFSMIIGVFTADQWLAATVENFPLREPIEGRFGFIGKPAEKEVSEIYLGKKLPDDYRKKGASNPIRYNF
jgi:hypothetical protein